MDKFLLLILFILGSVLCASMIIFCERVIEHKTERMEILNGTYDGCLYVCTHKIFEFPSTKIACMHNCELSEYLKGGINDGND